MDARWMRSGLMLGALAFAGQLLTSSNGRATVSVGPGLVRPERLALSEPIGHSMKYHLPRRHTPLRPAHVLAGFTIACAALLASAAWTTPTSGQSVLDRPPHLSDGWVVSPGVLQFNFLHRFQQSGPPDRKISASPSFHLGIGLPAQLMLGVQYATNSTVADRFPNEWQFFGRYAALSEEGASPVDLAVDAGYNLAARSIDGELALARTLGRVRLVTAARAFSNAYDDEDKDARFALGAGASLRITDNLALAGDFASLLDRDDDEEIAWGAGVQLQIPTTPHTLSLQVANTNTATLQGISVGEDRLRYGFEFTVPITLRRYLPRPSSPPVAAADTADEDAGPAVERTDAGNVVRIDMEGLAYESERVVVPVGTTVVWNNEDPVMHTVTAEDESWDSADINPGESWERTFDEPGTYPYWCRPHPFMTAVIVVEP